MGEESYDNYAEVETRKRPLDDTSTGQRAKKPALRTDQPLLKLLIPNYAAGALIGKGGSLINQMQEKFGGTLRLSANRECYPGTGERIVIISGEVDQLLDYNTHIMEKVTVDENLPTEKRPRNEGRGQQVKIVLTNSAAGLLIGKAGATIKAIQENTKAKITIGGRDEASVPGERVLTMSGSMDQRLEACRQVIQIIAEEPTNMANHHLKYMGGSRAFNTNNLGGNNAMGNFGMGGHQNPSSLMSGFQGANNMDSAGDFGMGGYQNQNSGKKIKASVQVQMEVPNVLVGGIMGKQGQIMHDMHRNSGAKIQFSAKDEFAPGTTNRILTITGDMYQAHSAYDLVNQRAEQVRNELGSGDLQMR